MKSLKNDLETFQANMYIHFEWPARMILKNKMQINSYPIGNREIQILH